MAVGNKKTGTLNSVLDYWNAAYRGFVPGGLNEVPPEDTDIGPDPEPIDTPNDPFVLADPEVQQEQNIVPVPVVLMDDLTHTRKRVEKYIVTMTANVDAVTPRILLPRDPFRTQAIIQAAGSAIFLGHNESVLTGGATLNPVGFALPMSQVVVLGTTREVWVLASATPPALATVSVLMEYDRDTS